jgi:hypothetical protein
MLRGLQLQHIYRMRLLCTFYSLDNPIRSSKIMIKRVSEKTISPLWGFDCICGINSTNIISLRGFKKWNNFDKYM